MTQRALCRLLLAGSLTMVAPGARSQEPGHAAAALEQRLAALQDRVSQLERQLERVNKPTEPSQMEERLGELEARISALVARWESAPSAAPVSAHAAPSEPNVLAAQTSLPLVTQPAQAGVSPVPQVPEVAEMSTPPYAGYMEMHLNQAREEPTLLDFHRFVLLFGHSFSPRMKFWSELEVEHAFIEGGEASGEIAVEQAFLDFFLKPQLNLRAGILLAPVGIVNERHEPPSFFGVERPFVDTVIIPTTWFDAGFGLHGDLGRGFSYKLYAMAPPDATGFSAGEGIAGGRQHGFLSVFNSPGVTGRMEYRGVPRLTLGTSFFTANTGFNLPDLDPWLNLFEFDGRYRRGRAEFRGQFAQYWLSQSGDLNRTLQLQTGVNPNIAKSSLGYYLETAYHLLPSAATGDIAPFFRYEKFNTQHRMPGGFTPLPQFDRSAYTLGLTYRPHPDIAIKTDYQFLRNRSTVVPISNRFNMGVGWWF
jgi:hypothetical protein